MYVLPGIKVLVVLLLLLSCCGPVVGESQSTAQPLRIALVADTHTSAEPQHAEYNEHFRQVISDVNAHDVDAVLIAGDLANHGREEEHHLYLELVQGFSAPVYSVAGNHDVGNKVMPEKKSSLSDKRLDAYEQRVGQLYYTADLSPSTRLVALTSSLLGSGLDREEMQWRFLEQELPSKHGERVILLMHYPLYVDQPDEPGGYMNLEPEPRTKLLEIIEQAGVRLVLCGHQHRPMERTLDGIRMITAPPVSFGLPKGEQDVGWTLINMDSAGDVRLENRYVEPVAPVQSHEAGS